MVMSSYYTTTMYIVLFIWQATLIIQRIQTFRHRIPLSSYKHWVVHQTNSKKPKPTKYKLLLLYTEKEILEY